MDPRTLAFNAFAFRQFSQSAERIFRVTLCFKSDSNPHDTLSDQLCVIANCLPAYQSIRQDTIPYVPKVEYNKETLQMQMLFEAAKFSETLSDPMKKFTDTIKICTDLIVQKIRNCLEDLQLTGVVYVKVQYSVGFAARNFVPDPIVIREVPGVANTFMDCLLDFSMPDEIFAHIEPHTNSFCVLKTSLYRLSHNEIYTWDTVEEDANATETQHVLYETINTFILRRFPRLDRDNISDQEFLAEFDRRELVVFPTEITNVVNAILQNLPLDFTST